MVDEFLVDAGIAELFPLLDAEIHVDPFRQHVFVLPRDFFLTVTINRILTNKILQFTKILSIKWASCNLKLCRALARRFRRQQFFTRKESDAFHFGTDGSTGSENWEFHPTVTVLFVVIVIIIARHGFVVIVRHQTGCHSSYFCSWKFEWFRTVLDLEFKQRWTYRWCYSPIAGYLFPICCCPDWPLSHSLILYLHQLFRRKRKTISAVLSFHGVLLLLRNRCRRLSAIGVSTFPIF